MDDMQRGIIARQLAHQDMLEFLLMAYLDEKPIEARAAIMSFLQSCPRNNAPETPVSDTAAEIWSDIAVKRIQEIERSLSRVRDLLAGMPQR